MFYNTELLLVLTLEHTSFTHDVNKKSNIFADSLLTQIAMFLLILFTAQSEVHLIYHHRINFTFGNELNLLYFDDSLISIS